MTKKNSPKKPEADERDDEPRGPLVREVTVTCTREYAEPLEDVDLDPSANLEDGDGEDDDEPPARRKRR